MPEHDPESAVEQLLGRADAPPTIDPEARARILSRLREASRGQPAGEVTDLRAGAPANDGASAERPATPAPQGPRRRWSPLGLALALAACLALFWGLPKLLLQSRAEDPLGDAIARHVADAGARPEAVALADGSVVWLRAGAAVDELDRRRIRVRGEVFLKVAAGRVPFVVETPQGAAQAAGELLIEAGDAQSKIAVARGRAELQGADTPRLRAGEQATLRADAAPEVSVARRLTHMLAWARPLLRENEPAPAVARRGNLVARDPNQAIWGSGAGEWPLPIRRLDVDVVIEDGVARTTLDSTFFNPAQLTLEGFYSFPLPSDAAISRLAMYVDGALMEGGIVERQRGRTIFESIVYQRRDPALLEQMAGNEFRVRVFPLPGRQQKRLFLSYVEPLDELYGAQSLRVPLPELDQPVGAVNISVRVKGADGWTLRSASHPLAVTAGAELSGTWHDEQVVLGDDLLLELRPEGEAPATHAARDGDRWLLRGRPDLGAAAEATARRWVILYDTSASRDAGELAAQERLLAHLLRAIDGDDRFTVIAFDAALRELGPLRPVGEIDPAQVRAWARREGGDHVGATDLAGALTRAAAILRDAEAPASEAPVILYLGDGVVHGDEQAVRRLIEGAGEGVPVIAAALGDPTDMPTLVALAEATGGMTTLIDAGEDLAWRARDLVAAIATPRLVDLEVDLLDSDGQRLDAGPVDLDARALSDGEAVLVTATSSKAPAALRIRGTLDGAPFQQRLTLPPARDDAGYVDTLWARARIAALLADDAEANREAITELGLDNFLVTPFTSLLVVESEAMAERFKLTRPTSTWAPYAAPKSIPVRTEPSERLGDVRRGAYVHRSPLEILVDPSDYANQQGWWGLQEDGAHVLGGLGFVGTGRGGGGVGQGSIGLGNGSLLSGGASERSQVSASLSDLAASVDADAPVTTTGAAAVDEVQATRDLAEKESFKRAEASPTRERRARGSGRFEFGARGLTRGHYYGNAVMRPYPRALSSSGDPRLDDLSAFVPGLLEAGVDHERQRLVAASARAGAGSITPEARALIDRAREAAPTGAFAEAESGDTLEVRGGGALLRRRTIGGYLREEVLYDGAILRTLYPDLDLEVRRDLRGAPTLLYERWAPWVLADADALAAVFVVEAVGERGVRLRRPGAAEADASAIDLHFDARGR
ncbi:MAG: VIT domain-containing protein, partial [Nannocystaceae bacterium]